VLYQPPSSTAPPSHEEQVTSITSQPQKTHILRQAKRGQVTKIPQFSGPSKKVGDEAVYTGRDDRVVRAAITATSLEAEHESGNIHKTRSTETLNELSPHGIGFGSGPRCQDTILGDANAHTRNLKKRIEEGDFDDDFNDTDDMVDKAIEYVEGDTVNAGDAVNTAIVRVSIASASVTTVGVSISTAEPRRPPTTTTKAFEDENITIAQTLVKMQSEKAKEKGVVFINVEESTRPTTILPTIDPKDKGKGITLHEEEKVELERLQRDRSTQEEASNAALTVEFDDVQARIDADALLAARLQEEER
nr:hypothetical protein [Tanacetum cinerariifolium]